ncbi:hypothetical protein L7F22_010548 [Adiantum nelumboides]|nr:hypothetical protein [Adiantum nelumboides]
MLMWRKRCAKDDFIDDGSNEEKLARKVAKKESNDNEGIVAIICELSGHRKATLKSFKGKVYIDIREFYMKTSPAKKEYLCLWISGKCCVTRWMQSIRLSNRVINVVASI